MKKNNLFLFVIVGICILSVAVHTFNRHTAIKQDIDLNTAEWNTIYTINSFRAIEGTFFGIINGGNNDNAICVRVLDENEEIVCGPFFVALGEQKDLDFMKDGYIIQAKSVKECGNYRICIVNKGMIM